MNNRDDHESDRLFRQAKEGDAPSLGILLNAERPALLTIARRELPLDLQVRVSPSDIVQITFLDIQRALPDANWASIAEWRSYLKVALLNNIRNAVRDHTETQKRDVRNELSLEQAPANGGSPREQTVADHTSPFQRVLRNERDARLLAALEELIPDQRTAVRRKHLEGRTLSNIAQEMQRSEQAVASLLQRGLTRLRQLLEEKP